MSKTGIRIIQVFILAALLVLIGFNGKQRRDLPHMTQIVHDTSFVDSYFDEKYDLIPDTVYQIYRVETPKGETGHIIYSEDLEAQSKGFAGPVNFAVITDADYRIRGIEILSNSETKSYIDWIREKGFFTQWQGMTPEEVLAHEADVVSGASMTCNAVVANLKASLERISEYHSSYRSTHRLFVFKNLAAMLFLVFAILHFFFPRRLKNTRWILLILSVVILGAWCGYYLSMALFHTWLLNGIHLQMQAYLLVLVILSVVLPLFTKRGFYCQYVCPYGALQEIAGRLFPFSLELGCKTKQVLRYVRIGFLALILILLAIGVILPLANMEPFSVFRIQAASIVVIILAIVFLLLSMLIRNFWCRYLCPTGMLLDLFRKPIVNISKKK